jgi:integrase
MTTTAIPPKPKARHTGRRSHGARCPFCKLDHGTGGPWYNASRDYWSINVKDVNGRKTGNRMLTKGWENHDEAIELWRHITAGSTNGNGSKAPILECGDRGEEMMTGEILNAWWCRKRDRHGKGTHRVNELKKLFAEVLAAIGDRPIRELRRGVGVDLLEKFFVGKTTWADSTKFNRLSFIQAAFNHAVKRQWIDSNPLRHANSGDGAFRTKPRRECWLTPEQADAMIANARTEEAALAFEILRLVGCRPGSLCKVTAPDVKVGHHGGLFWLFSGSRGNKAYNKTGKPLKIRSYPRSESQRRFEEITNQQMAKYPTGCLFRNSKGEPWRPKTLQHTWDSTADRDPCKQIGLAERKQGDADEPREMRRFTCYSFRHTCAVEWLSGIRGEKLGYEEVSTLLGNKAEEVEKTYGHLDETL